mgnify:CR=1 FL=1
MQYWAIQTLNSLALGGLLFLLAAGFSLIFGLMRIANLTHGALYMLGAYLGVTILRAVPNLWLAALIGGIAVALHSSSVPSSSCPASTDHDGSCATSRTCVAAASSRVSVSSGDSL